MIGSMISGGLQVAGAVAGGIAAAQSAKKQAAMLQEQKDINSAYNTRYQAQDFTMRSDAQASINSARETFLRNQKNLAATAATGGATDEAQAQAKALANKSVADVTSNIAASASAAKEAQQQQYMSREQQIAQQQLDVEQQKAQAIAAAASQVSQAGAAFSKAI